MTTNIPFYLKKNNNIDDEKLYELLSNEEDENKKNEKKKVIAIYNDAQKGFELFLEENDDIDSTEILKIAKQRLDKLYNSISDEEDNLPIYISNKYLETHIKNTIGDDPVFQLGIHTVLIRNDTPTKERLQLELSALFHLCNMSNEIIKKNSNCHIETLRNSENALTYIISINAFKKFQCIFLGSELYKKKQDKFVKKVLNGQEHFTDKCPNNYKIISETFGEIELVTDKDIDNLLQKTRWCTNIFNAYNKDKDHFYITNSNKKYN